MKKFFKYLFRFLLFVIIIGLILGLIYRKKLKRVYNVMNLFDKEVIIENFRNMDKIVETTVVHKGDQSHTFAKNDHLQLPETFSYQGEKINTADFLKHIQNTGFLILMNDTIVYEKYNLGHEPSTQHISWSVSKSFVSALFGIAIEEGKIRSVEETATDYLPELKGTGYDNVKIKDILQMSTGVGFNEDYGDFYSDINRMGRTIAFGSSMDKFAASLKNESEPGKYNHYVSINTHVLSMIIRKATGQTLTKYLEEKIWKPLGMEYDAKWIVDDYKVEFALGGLLASLRDYAKFGQLYLKNGNWNGQQIVPKDWVIESTTPDAPHLMPGRNNNSTTTFGYGYQWWIPPVPQNDFAAAGVYNQHIYVSRDANMVIAFNSSNYHFTEPGEESKPKCIALFQEIAKVNTTKKEMELVNEEATN